MAGIIQLRYKQSIARVRVLLPLRYLLPQSPLHRKKLSRRVCLFGCFMKPVNKGVGKTQFLKRYYHHPSFFRPALQSVMFWLSDCSPVHNRPQRSSFVLAHRTESRHAIVAELTQAARLDSASHLWCSGQPIPDTFN